MVLFQMLMFQKEPLIKKSADIRRLLMKTMDMWENCDNDVLMSEAIQWNESSKIKRRNPTKQEQEHEHLNDHNLSSIDDPWQAKGCCTMDNGAGM